MKHFSRATVVMVILATILSACSVKTTPPFTASSPMQAMSRSDPAAGLPFAGSISGIIIDQTGEPVAQATVRIQATANQTLSKDDGTFILSKLEKGNPVTISAWKAGYYCGKIDQVIPPADDISIRLRLVQTNDNPNYEWISPTGENSCYSCKPGLTQVWLDNDTHGKSTTNIRFLNMYNGTDVYGNQSPVTQYSISRDYGRIPLRPDMSKPYFGPGYKLDFPDTAGNCGACHIPGAAVDAPYDTDPNSVSGVNTFGIHCDYCHKVANIKLEPSTGLPYTNMPGVLSQDIRRPFPDDEERYQIFFGSFDDDNVPMEDTYLPLIKESQWCAPCHYGVFWNTVIYNSFGEWLESPYSDKNTGRTCQQCHMQAPTIVNGRPISNVAPEKGGVERDILTIHAHTFPGAASIELLKNAVSMSASASRIENIISVTVTLLNDQTGHDVPTDSPLRQLILLVRAQDDREAALLQIDGPIIPDYGGEGKPEEGYYAGQAGKIYAKTLMELWTEISPTGAYWNSVQIVSDNRLSAYEADTSSYIFKAPTSGKASIEVKLLYRRAFKELADQKGWEIPDIVMEESRIIIP